MRDASSIIRSLSLGLASACGGDEPEPGDLPDAQSAYVDFYVDEDIRVCGGQLEAYDRFIERIFDFWTGGEPDDFRVDVHVVNQRPCPGGAVACADPWGVYLGSQFGEYHELVHAMHIFTDGLSAPSIDEGLATALGPGAPLTWTPGEGNMVDVLFKPSPSAGDYGGYAVFTRFLLERHGVEAYRAYFHGMVDPEKRSPEKFEREFELAFGEELDMAWSAFQGESRCAYDFWYCDERRPIDLPFILEGLDCDDPKVQGFDGPIPEVSGGLFHPFKPTHIVHVDNPEPRRLRIEMESVSINIGRCGDCSEQHPFREFGLERSTFAGSCEGDVAELDFEAGTYAFTIMQRAELQDGEPVRCPARVSIVAVE